MAENSKIEWCHHTWNPWWGCTKVSAGCANCYAETLDGRYNAAAPHWGLKADRKAMSEAYWKQPLKWNREASNGPRPRVFCASMADVFEDRDDLHESRLRLLDLMRCTPKLDWLLLTKRPENIRPALSRALTLSWNRKDYALAEWLRDWVERYPAQPPANVWLGTSAEDQAAADKRIGHLVSVSAVVKFLSCEPLLGPLNLSPWLGHGLEDEMGDYDGVSWVIAGGESGPKARPMNPDWVRDIRDQCLERDVAFHFKQWGEWAPDCLCGSRNACRTIERPFFGKRGVMFRCGKKKAGRILDGRTWDELPQVLEPAKVAP